MRSLQTLVALLVMSSVMMAARCNPVTTIKILSPVASAQTTSCSIQLDFQLVGAFSSAPTVTLNFSPLSVPVVESPPGTFTATIGAEDGLQDSNILTIQATRASDGATLTQGVSFSNTPQAKAFQITSPTELLTGPLAHNRIGDYILESCVARFVVQDGGQRDLYSVGQYGGNLIDAERIGSPGLDNFLEIQPGVNLETVVNATSVIVVNDGTDDNPAVVRACGPDDLLDFANPSASIADVGIVPPPNMNDNDQTIDACTDYTIAARDSHVEMTTTYTNTGGATLNALTGDWLNQAGELDVYQLPNSGVGPAATGPLTAMSFFGKGGALGVDYSYVSPPANVGSYVTVSGVTIVLENAFAVLALVGIEVGAAIAPGASYSFTRYLGVGDGSGGNAVDLDIKVRGLAKARVEGCITVGGSPAANARVTVAAFGAAAAPANVATHFTTDTTGCYGGNVPVVGSPTAYGVIAGRVGTLFEAGAALPAVHPISVNAGDTATVNIDLPATGSLMVTATDDSGGAVPARVTVVGFDPSPITTFAGASLPGFGAADLALLFDPDDRLPFGVVAADNAGANGIIQFDLEPGSYRVIVSRGTGVLDL